MFAKYNGQLVDNKIQFTQEQVGPPARFVDMDIVQDTPGGVSDILMYDKREHMESFSTYRTFPHVEIRLSTARRALYAVFT